MAKRLGSLVIGVALGAFVLAPFLPPEVINWPETSFGAPSNEVLGDTDLIGTVEETVVGNVGLSNALFELIPERGSTKEHHSPYTPDNEGVHYPPWADVVATSDSDGESTLTVVRFRGQLDARNLSNITLKEQYWTAQAYGLMDHGWIEGYGVLLDHHVTVAPGESASTSGPGRLVVNSTFPPGIKKIRFTITYAEPGQPKASATVDYPW